MNDTDPIATGLFILFAIIVIFISGLCVGVWCRDQLWEESAIKAGVGEYNSKTSKFQWANDQNQPNTAEATDTPASGR